MPLRAPPIVSEMKSELTAWFAALHFVVNGITQSGATATRPTRGVFVGMQFYDTTLNKPVFASAINPIVWRDAAGVIV